MTFEGYVDVWLRVTLGVTLDYRPEHAISTDPVARIVPSIAAESLEQKRSKLHSAEDCVLIPTTRRDATSKMREG